jgi:hypothetical protein
MIRGASHATLAPGGLLPNQTQVRPLTSNRLCGGEFSQEALQPPSSQAWFKRVFFLTFFRLSRKG